MTLVWDRTIAKILENAANVVSGLELSEIGEDGHSMANRLWRIAAYLRTREGMISGPEIVTGGNTQKSTEELP